MRASCALDESGVGVTLFTILFGFLLLYCAICGDGEESDSDDEQPDGMYT